MYRDVTCHHDRRSEWQAASAAACYDYWTDYSTKQTSYVCMCNHKEGERVMKMFLTDTRQHQDYEQRRRGEERRERGRTDNFVMENEVFGSVTL